MTLIEGYVVTVSGKRVPLAPQSICVHGDRPNAPEVARAVRRRVESAGHVIRSVHAPAEIGDARA